MPKKLKPWYLLVLTLISGVICIFALRANNEHMITLRNAVYQADKNNTDVQATLQKLQAYVTRHMNTNLSAGPNAVYPPIQLQYTYERLVEAENAKLTQGNPDLYTEAQQYCEKQDPVDFSGHNRVPCIQQYVLTHTSQAPAAIPDALYKFSFVSPRWSPDLAGWSLVTTILCALLTLVSFLAQLWPKHTSSHSSP